MLEQSGPVVSLPAAHAAQFFRPGPGLKADLLLQIVCEA
jgi:hypothetical protein